VVAGVEAEVVAGVLDPDHPGVTDLMADLEATALEVDRIAMEVE